MRKLTALEVELRLGLRLIELIYYAGSASSNQSIWRCLVFGCGFIWKCRAETLFRREPTGCPKCAGSIKPTEEEIRAIVEPRDIDLIYLGETYNDKSWWRHRKCNYEWEAHYEHIIREGRHGCPKCAGKILPTAEEVDLHLVNRPVKRQVPLLENSTKKIPWGCTLCGLDFEAHWGNIQSGHNCPKCFSLGYSRNVLEKRFQQLIKIPSKFYIVSLEYDGALISKFGVGIMRPKRHEAKGAFIVREVLISKAEAIYIELIFKEGLVDRLPNLNDDPAYPLHYGGTECFEPTGRIFMYETFDGDILEIPI